MKTVDNKSNKSNTLSPNESQRGFLSLIDKTLIIKIDQVFTRI